MAPSLSNASSSASPLQAGGCTDSVITLDSFGFSAGGHLFLTDVPLNVTAAPSPYSLDGKSLTSPGCFVGFDAAEPNSRHVAPVGRLSGIRFMCIFRFMVWWTTHRTGYDGRDLEHETQIMILDRSDSGRPYVLLLPLLEGPFRASIQPGSDDFVDLCVESGSTQVTSDEFRAILYLHAGDDPFVLVRDAIKVARHHLGTFKPLSEKNPPPIVDKFGWCTWDELYLTVHPQGIREGVKGLADGGCPPGFVLIDDGWQSISHDADRQMLCRLLKFLKEEFVTVEHVYVWHSLCGYGIGLVPPEMVHLMYEGLHSDFRSVGIDGVKVVDIHLPEMLGENYGGRVELAKAYYKALTESVRKHFNGNGVIASMENCNDFMFLGTEAISLGRVGDDFWCTDPSDNLNITFWLQGCHMVHCAYNSLWMGNFIQPDWDMFQSTHPCAEFHAASRAISGGPIYVNDSVGKHNFSLLKKLVLPDGSILRCEYYALPTQDCLFVDPVHDGKTMLKMWNLNKFTGVIGAFNCQGGGWCRESRRNKCTAQFPRPVTCKTSPKDVEWNSGKSPIPVDGVHIFALYLSQSKRLVLYKPSQDLEITLEPFEFELVTVSPVTELEGSDGMVEFAPIGLANMLNTGGALQSLKYGEGSVEVGVKGSGELKAFSSVKLSHCKINGKDVEFEYAGLMATVQVPWPGSSSELSSVEFLF